MQAHGPEYNRVLEALPEEVRARLLRRAERVDLPQGTVMVEQDRPITEMFFPLSGVVSLVIRTKEGGVVEVGTVGRDGFVDARVNGHEVPATMSAISQVAGRSLRIPAEDFVEEQRREAELRDVTIALLQSLLAQTAQAVACNRLHPIPQRLARWLLGFHDRVDGDEFRLTHQFMAQMLGVRRASVTVATGDLEHRGAIRHRRGHIHVVDRMGLEALSCECYFVIRQETQGRFPLLTVG